MTDGSTAAVLRVASTFETCILVDALGPEGTGELVLHGEDGPRGLVFVEEGRVCWAAALGLAPRLKELLLHHAALGATDMEAVFQRCQEERVPFGEYLVRHGILEPSALRGALLQHTVESLLHVCVAGGHAEWRARAGRGYNPQFTFTTTELLAHLGAIQHGDVAAGAQLLLSTFFEPGDRAVAFVRSIERARPELVASLGPPLPVTMMIRLGNWAGSALDVAEAISDADPLVTVLRSGGPLVAFRQGAVTVAGETSACGPARILNRRAQHRRGRGNADL